MNDKPKALDLFCCGGGVSAGLVAAGFDVVGVDKKRSKNYPFDFIECDVLEFADKYSFDGFSFVWASPPCQFASESTPKEYRAKHQNLISATRRILNSSRLPYVIENVENARHHLINPFLICGSMLGMNLFRHRYFESNIFWLNDLPPCDHSFTPVVVSGHSNRTDDDGNRLREYNAEQKRAAMQIPHFVNRDELSQAIPPPYSEYIGRKIIQYLNYAN